MDEFQRSDIFYTIVNNEYDNFLKELASLDDINIVDVNGMSLLHFCCEYSRPKFAEHLIDKEINLELKDVYGNNALWKATFNARGTYELVILLIENEADPNSKNNAHKSPFELALTFGDEQLIGLLSEPEFKYYADWKQLSKLFDYELDKHDQDWTYIVAEPERFEDYFDAYHDLENFEAKFSLIEMMIQAVNDQPSDTFNASWDKLVSILDLDFELHKTTIYYWCCWTNEHLEDCFTISKRMREYWIHKIKEQNGSYNL